MCNYCCNLFLCFFDRNVSLPFQWMIYKPQFDSPGADSAARKYDRVPDVDSVFSVHPPTGVLPAAESMEFKITYAPPVVCLYSSTLDIVTLFCKYVHSWFVFLLTGLF